MNRKKFEQALSRYFAVRGDAVAPADREIKHYLMRMRRKGIVITFQGCVFYEVIDLPVDGFQSRRKRGQHAK